jgi:hypothetical protein
LTISAMIIRTTIAPASHGIRIAASKPSPMSSPVQSSMAIASEIAAK